MSTREWCVHTKCTKSNYETKFSHKFSLNEFEIAKMTKIEKFYSCLQYKKEIINHHFVSSRAQDDMDKKYFFIFRKSHEY